MELVARTSELARVFGIDFFSVPCYTPLATSLLHPLSTLCWHTSVMHPLITLPGHAPSPRAARPRRCSTEARSIAWSLCSLGWDAHRT
jgi:hypothetical protein